MALSTAQPGHRDDPRPGDGGDGTTGPDPAVVRREDPPAPRPPAHRSGVPDLPGQIAALDSALAAGARYLDPDAVARTREVLAKVGERSRLGARTTVVALVGATGSGKSTLFNAISGLEIAETGATRPTTSKPLACLWGRDLEDPVLDYVDVPRRHRMERESVLDGDREVPLHGLVLLDLPDHDSTSLEHRIEVDRLVGLVDLMVWVVDPQKYADEALHARYLQKLTGHDGVMLVVLNQVDRLSPEEVELCERDLRRLLDADGLGSVRLLTASAVRGDGVETLRSILGEVVARQTAVPQRLAADLDDVQRGLLAGVADAEPDLSGEPAVADLPGALAAAAGVPLVAAAAAAEYRRQGRSATGWPPARWVRALRRDPVQRLRLGEDQAAVQDGARGLRPATAPVDGAAADAAVQRVTSAAGAGLTPRWADAVRAAVPSWVGPSGSGLADALDQAVAGVSLGPARRWWFRLFTVLQAVALLAVLGGLGLLAAVTWGGVEEPTVDLAGARLDDLVDRTRWGGSGALVVDAVPLSVVLVVGGLLAAVVLSLLARWCVGVGARRRARRARTALDAAVAGVATHLVVEPVAEVLAAHRRTREALAGTGRR